MTTCCQYTIGRHVDCALGTTAGMGVSPYTVGALKPGDILKTRNRYRP